MASITLQPRCTTTTNAGRSHHRHARPCRARLAVATTGSMAANLSVAAVLTSAVKTTTTTTRSRGSVASMWRQVQGSTDWAGLLQPLHPVVRDEVARYGEQVDACYSALNMDSSSPRYMCCKHGKDAVLGDAGRGYEVTRYIYATPDVGATSSWIGYVAVSTDEMTRRLGRRDVLVAFRGTVTRAEWAANLKSSLAPVRLHDDVVKVESGFLNLYTSAAGGGMMGSCRDQLLREVSRLVASLSSGHDDVSVTLAGHSMGSALAMLLAYDLAELGLNRGAPVTVFSFGGPRVGNAAFKARCDALGVKALRVANVRDPVTKLPGAFLNERTPRGLLLGGADCCYTHVGVELALDFLRLRDLTSVHDLATYVASLRAEETNAAAGGGGGVLAQQGIMEFTAAY